MDRERQYVRLAPPYVLRGWLDMLCALVDARHARVAAIPKAVFDTLLFCNGKFRPADPVFMGARRTYLKHLEQEGVLLRSDEPCPLDAEQEFRTYPNRFLREVQWSMTGRCNYRCRHCYMSAPHAKFSQPSTRRRRSARLRWRPASAGWCCPE